MVITTRPCNATKHPGLRARGDPDELAEAAAKKKERLAKQSRRARDTDKKKTRAQKVARFEDELLDEMNEEDRKAAEIKPPRVKKKGSERQPAEAERAATKVLEPTETDENEDWAGASSQVEPDEVSVDGASETELVKKKTSKKKATTRDEIESLRVRRRTIPIVEDQEDKSDETDMETPHASQKTHGQNKGNANPGIDDSRSQIPFPSYNNNFSDDVSSAQWGSTSNRKNTSTLARTVTETAPAATAKTRGGNRGRGRGRGAGTTGRVGRANHGEQDDVEVAQEAAGTKRSTAICEDDPSNQDTNDRVRAGARGRSAGRAGRAGHGRGRGGEHCNAWDRAQSRLSTTSRVRGSQEVDGGCKVLENKG
ncbi:hypothetical protein CERSUDRAFT_71724 [Gelatoporia subvermispora B]|uniref:Uncharacterized protein n=1 Tax=Ceriporiopsis subvermispora (strain B) TaxID=914234 RepID=M2R5L2_CERS8|nr:hypothetical protein CERSUDRAFT_71724 [Gelatoporia subvermispora B]